jgi:hypothetical protein
MEQYKTTYKNGSYTREKIDLDGKAFINCSFEECIFVLERGETDLVQCEIKNSRLMLKGNAYKIARIIKLFTHHGPLKVLDLEQPLFEKKKDGE